ncbi:hypothetical protein Syun_000798 [Stephania yunnanensis]|uniref:Uncharacterized protein n=1 Tax=Stephania yunnanensis TaxID=152371 RepID=A0AAP0LCL3_9MAGN
MSTTFGLEHRKYSFQIFNFLFLIFEYGFPFWQIHAKVASGHRLLVCVLASSFQVQFPS